MRTKPMLWQLFIDETKLVTCSFITGSEIFLFQLLRITMPRCFSFTDTRLDFKDGYYPRLFHHQQVDYLDTNFGWQSLHLFARVFGQVFKHQVGFNFERIHRDFKCVKYCFINFVNYPNSGGDNYPEWVTVMSQVAKASAH